MSAENENNVSAPETGDKRKASQEPTEVEDVKKQKTDEEPTIAQTASANASAKAPESYAEPGDTEGLPEAGEEGKEKNVDAKAEDDDDEGDDEDVVEAEGEGEDEDEEEIPVEKDEVDPSAILPEDEGTGRRPRRKAAAKVDYSSEEALKKAGIDPSAPEEDDEEDATAPEPNGDESMDVSGDLHDDEDDE